MKNLTLLVILVLSAAIGVVAQVAVKKTASTSGKTENHHPNEPTLKAVAAEVNKSTPLIVDKDTTLDFAFAHGNTFTYSYTLSNIDSKNYVKGTLQKNNFEVLRNKVCTNSGMKNLINLGAILNYTYKDLRGVELDTIPIDTSLCGNSGK